MSNTILLPDRLVQHAATVQRTWFEHVLVPKAIPWNQDTIEFQEFLCIQGKTYRPHILFDVEAVPADEPYANMGQIKFSECGRYIYAERILPRGHSIKLTVGRQKGHCFFDTDVIVPMLCELPGRLQSPRSISLVTPEEAINHNRLIQKFYGPNERNQLSSTRGSICLGGLGSGWLLTRLCQMPAVDNVIMVERSGSLVNWLGPRLQELYPCVAEKVSAWIIGDAVAEIGKHGPMTYLLDVWDNHGAATFDREFQAKKAQYEYSPFRVFGLGDLNDL